MPRLFFNVSTVLRCYTVNLLLITLYMLVYQYHISIRISER